MMPSLRHLDLTWCEYLPSLLGSLGQLCPQLETLRLGDTVWYMHPRKEKTAVKALLQSLPRVLHRSVQESWEDEEQTEVLPSDKIRRLCLCKEHNNKRHHICLDLKRPGPQLQWVLDS
jgi:hypothetical protein